MKSNMRAYMTFVLSAGNIAIMMFIVLPSSWRKLWDVVVKIPESKMFHQQEKMTMVRKLQRLLLARGWWRKRLASDQLEETWVISALERIKPAVQARFEDVGSRK